VTLGIGATKYIGVPPAFSSLGPSLPTNVVLSLAIFSPSAMSRLLEV
jgi:hypothetical protein